MSLKITNNKAEGECQIKTSWIRAVGAYSITAWQQTTGSTTLTRLTASNPVQVEHAINGEQQSHP